MPPYYSNEKIIDMFNNSEEVIHSYDTQLQNVKNLLYTINMYNTVQSYNKNNLMKYYDYQYTILFYTEQIGKIIYPISNLKYKSIKSNLYVSYEEEYMYIKYSINELKSKERHIKIMNKRGTYTNKLIEAGMDKILPVELLENVAYHLVYKRPNKKKPSTNWQNFCKHRKLEGLNYKDNSSIWQSLHIDIKNKYKNPYYKHF